MNIINFSFIIPHKNTPDLLQKCIDSIPHRGDVQIIVVDDNSDADKVDFSNFPGLNDPTVDVYLTKEGKGAGYARNVGLEHAVGKWIVFADADDFFMPCVVSFLDTHKNSSADIVFWEICSYDIDTGKLAFRGSAINEYNSEAEETGNFENLLLISHLYKGMYSSRLIVSNNIRFNESKWGNDVMFSTKIAIAAKKEEVFGDVVYCITQHSKFGLVSNPTTESRVIRLNQEIQSIKLSRRVFKKNRNIHLWFFQTWFALYKCNKKEGIRFLPKVIMADKVPFIKECLKAKFS